MSSVARKRRTTKRTAARPAVVAQAPAYVPAPVFFTLAERTELAARRAKQLRANPTPFAAALRQKGGV